MSKYLVEVTLTLEVDGACDGQIAAALVGETLEAHYYESRDTLLGYDLVDYTITAGVPVEEDEDE